jgi:flagellar motor switch protein FliG
MSSNAAKAASMFVLLGEEVASGIMRHLSEGEIEQLSREISNVGAISSDQAEADAEEMYQMLVANRFVSEGGVDYARKVILKTLGAGSAKRIIDRLSSSYASTNAFQSIDKVNPIQLSQFIQHEHPQTIALVLAHLKPRTAAELLETLADELQSDVAVRMANIEDISPEVISTIAGVLEEKLKPVGSYTDGEGFGGIRAVAEMFNRLDRRMSKEVLEKIDVDKPEIANSIRQLMFIFEDISELDDTAMREILQRVDKKTISQALKGTIPELQNQFFRNMSQRAVEILREEMEIMGPMKTRDVQSSQQKIVEVVRQLEEEGVINVAGGADEYVL